MDYYEFDDLFNSLEEYHDDEYLFEDAEFFDEFGLNDEDLGDEWWEQGLRFVGTSKSTKNQTSQKGDTLFVRNLAKSVDVQKLTTLFAPFGTIARVNIIKDGLGTSKGFGFVRFANALDAAKALPQVNGRLLAGRKLHVAMAHPPKCGPKKEAGKKK